MGPMVKSKQAADLTMLQLAIFDSVPILCVDNVVCAVGSDVVLQVEGEDQPCVRDSTFLPVDCMRAEE